MGELEFKHKVFIVQQLACDKTLPEIVEAVKEQYDIEISRQAVHYYNPLRNEKLDEELARIFHETRAKIKEGTLEVPCSSQTYRLMMLQSLIDKANRRGQSTVVAKLLEQAAKEIGGFYSSKEDDGSLLNNLNSRDLAQSMLNNLIIQGHSAEVAKQTLITLGVDERDLSPLPIS